MGSLSYQQCLSSRVRVLVTQSCPTLGSCGLQPARLFYPRTCPGPGNWAGPSRDRILQALTSTWLCQYCFPNVSVHPTFLHTGLALEPLLELVSPSGKLFPGACLWTFYSSFKTWIISLLSTEPARISRQDHLSLCVSVPGGVHTSLAQLMVSQLRASSFQDPEFLGQGLSPTLDQERSSWEWAQRIGCECLAKQGVLWGWLRMSASLHS